MACQYKDASAANAGPCVCGWGSSSEPDSVSSEWQDPAQGLYYFKWDYSTQSQVCSKMASEKP